ncbi:alanine racemase [Rhodothermus profundi]|uniref:D-serine deaminase, pyridoxal phosphate-dependent n=1 Tax=Rhodothermus profundi TaxID=633813 RepID=A0A1M6RJ58_9BACT|nr:alanine racemase [Rhodothermus profundi]SHK32470.1 D-serine deaminase, pyridoxal phosphate-dependent [Rhodothermus profundi]
MGSRFLEQLPTPAALIDRTRLLKNLRAMQQRAAQEGVALRPHVKTHKSPDLARLQQEVGAVGITVATVDEAEAFVAAGFTEVRLAYPTVGADRYERLLPLMERARLSFCLDTPEAIREASAFFAERGRQARVLLEVDTGFGRTGVRWDDARHLVACARLIQESPGLRLIGLLTHAGQAYHGPQSGESPIDALRRVAAEERDRLLAAAVVLHQAGLATPGQLELSVGSTPTAHYFTNRTEQGFRITEMRPGNYVFHDAMQVALGSCTLDDCALTVLARVVSRKPDGRGGWWVFLDAGKKALSTDQGYGTQGYGLPLYRPASRTPLPHARIARLSEEHGWMHVRGGTTLQIGDRVQIVPNHACLVAPLLRRFYVVEGDEVVAEWAVAEASSVARSVASTC